MVTPEKIESEGDVLEGFMRAYAKATWAGLQNPEALEAMAREVVPEEWKNEDVGLATMELVLEAVTPDDPDRIGEVRSRVWDAAQDQLVEVGELEEPVDLEALLNDRFIEAANDWDRAEVEADMDAWLKENG